MRKLAMALVLLPAAGLAQNQADQIYDPTAMAAAREQMHHHHGGQNSWMILGERLEQRMAEGADDDALAWEAQGWYGQDLRRFWWKTEGEHADGQAEEAEVQLLYSQALAPFWDLQLGLRQDFEPSPSRRHAVIGLQGLAPYWFEIDAAAFISEGGDTSLRLEAEYELRLTQRLILQPRLELNHAFQSEPALQLGQGMREGTVDLRLRYELRREFAPYLGLSWRRAFGETADFLRRADGEREDLAVVAGIRFWY